MKVGDLVRRKEFCEKSEEKYKFGPVDTQSVGVVVGTNLTEHASYETYVVRFPGKRKTHVFTAPHLEIVSEA